MIQQKAGRAPRYSLGHFFGAVSGYCRYLGHSKFAERPFCFSPRLWITRNDHLIRVQSGLGPSNVPERGSSYKILQGAEMKSENGLQVHGSGTQPRGIRELVGEQRPSLDWFCREDESNMSLVRGVV